MARGQAAVARRAWRTLRARRGRGLSGRRLNQDLHLGRGYRHLPRSDSTRMMVRVAIPPDGRQRCTGGEGGHYDGPSSCPRCCIGILPGKRPVFLCLTPIDLAVLLGLAAIGLSVPLGLAAIRCPAFELPRNIHRDGRNIPVEETEVCSVRRKNRPPITVPLNSFTVKHLSPTEERVCTDGVSVRFVLPRSNYARQFGSLVSAHFPILIAAITIQTILHEEVTMQAAVFRDFRWHD